jgi:hypothetical protein
MPKFQPQYILTNSSAGYHAVCSIDGAVVDARTMEKFDDSFCWIEDHYEQEFSWRPWPGAAVQ